eukprot:11650119-Heterocapsa_arctica.AAC.1
MEAEGRIDDTVQISIPPLAPKLPAQPLVCTARVSACTTSSLYKVSSYNLTVGPLRTPSSCPLQGCPATTRKRPVGRRHPGTQTVCP